MRTETVCVTVTVVVDLDALDNENVNPQQVVEDEVTSNLESVRYVKSAVVSVIEEGERA